MGNGNINKLIYTAQGILGERGFICTARTVKSITSFIEEIFNVKVSSFPGSRIVNDTGQSRTYIKNLHLDLMECFINQKMLSELN
jgi:hypothetical protein